MEFERIPTVPTADEVLDRSFRRAAAKMRKKANKDRANEEFVRAVSSAVHDRLVHVIQSFPVFEAQPPFYRDTVEALFGIERLRMALGNVGWAAMHTKRMGFEHGGRRIRRAEDTAAMRKRAVARIASIVHQIDRDLRFLNDARNVLRKLPDVRDDEFTVVIAGYPNVGKSSFIRQVSSAAPEVASYPFTTKGVIVGHRYEGRHRIQFLDTPGLLNRPEEERNAIEEQAISAIVHTADLILFILDPSEYCGYPIEDQYRLLSIIEKMAEVPMIVVDNKADITSTGDRPAMSTATGEGVEGMLDLIRSQYREPSPAPAQCAPDEETEDGTTIEGRETGLRLP
ncbi:NOG1 family protein [Methanofollis fontis]|uniref:GTP-binding protein n=1 Tax=Methanofollis fontis TaxID=2052832 RepID=A0A483CUL7_9EURY|nr:GTPase [Methanofollis fontis]TAJ45014.1 GTP-binding protein [Methanofollis fontis]